jgi:DNA-binding transcriptional ArsR family regulator
MQKSLLFKIFFHPFFVGDLMTKISLRIIDNHVDENSEKGVIQNFIPDIIEICSNPVRAGIIHLLIKSPSTGHSLKVEDIAFRLGTYHRIILHHLERLKNWEIVDIKRQKKYGNKTKRSVWGLNLKYPNWIFEVYDSIKSGYSEAELRRICNRNKSMRNGIKNMRKIRKFSKHSKFESN